MRTKQTESDRLTIRLQKVLDTLRTRNEQPDTDLSWLPEKGAGIDRQLARMKAAEQLRSALKGTK